MVFGRNGAATGALGAVEGNRGVGTHQTQDAKYEERWKIRAHGADGTDATRPDAGFIRPE